MAQARAHGQDQHLSIRRDRGFHSGDCCRLSDLLVGKRKLCVGRVMQKVMVMIPTHCAPKVVMMTLGTWLETYDQSYRAEVLLGVHQNYLDYHPGLPELEALPHVRIAKVKEISWASIDRTPNPWDCVLRYSQMHALNIINLMKVVMGSDFTHVSVLDHDLVFRKDFVKWCLNQPVDLVGCYQADRSEEHRALSGWGVLRYQPKFSVWHMVLSAELYAKTMLQPELVEPAVRGDMFYDTFSRVVEKARGEWGCRVMVLSSADIENWVKHSWSMSFNFGMKQVGPPEYWKRMAEYEAEYDKRFPKGINHLLEKLA